MSESRADAGGVRKAPRHEIAVEHVTAVPRALWGLYERGTVKPDFWLFFTFIHSFVRPEEPILSSRPWVSAERGAQDLSRTAQ